MPAPPRKPRRKHSVAEMRANPAWRRHLTDAQLTPQQRKQRARNKALKADPLAPVATLGELEGQAGTLVDTQQAGDTAAIKADQARADAEFGTRSGMYRGLANFQTAGAQNAFQNVSNAVNAIIASTNAGNAQDSSMLAAALKKADDDQRAAYAQMGVAPTQPGQGGAAPLPGQVPQDVTAERLAALAGTQAGVSQQVGQAGAAQVGAEGAMMAIPGQGLAINLANLTGERNQTNKELEDRRKELTKQRPGLVRQAVRDLQDFELAKRQFGDQHANMLFQQYMAEKEFSLKEKQETFAQWLQTNQLSLQGRQQDLAERVGIGGLTGTDPKTGRPTLQARQIDQQFQIDWANVHINQTQANAAYQAALNESRTAKTKEKQDAAAQRAARIGKGIAALDAFLAPTQGEGAPPSATSRYPVGSSTALVDQNGKPVLQDNPKAGQPDPRTGNPQPDKIPVTGKPYVRRFNDALAHLKSQGLSHSDALRILSMSTYTDWKAKARGMLSRMKRRQRGEKAPEPKPKRKTKRKPSGAAGAIPGFGDVPQ